VVLRFSYVAGYTDSDKLLKPTFEMVLNFGSAELKNIEIWSGSFEQKLWYNSFRTLLTHHSTDGFFEEKSKLITRVNLKNERILCNGFYCKHFSYCKFFNYSETHIAKIT